MKALGVVEGFFGPEWPWDARHRFCETIRRAGGSFYIYAPKRDPYLRKNWTDDHPENVWKELKALRARCASLQLRFGVGLSPFEIHDHWTEATRAQLREKILKLEDLGSEELGLFFDDMKGAPDLAPKQAEIVDFVRSVTRQDLLFCPTYYSWDPVLDRVFGQRPDRYLEDIGRDIDPSVRILWTGDKVISETISAKNLDDVAKILKRAPFVWDNVFANDGPRQCKFLRLKPLTGRPNEAFATSAGWALNLMNQPSLSELLFEASARVLIGGEDSLEAYRATITSAAGSSLANLVIEQRTLFNDIGLDKMEPHTQTDLRAKLKPTDRFEAEILAWLDGKYLVGPECLTD